MNDKLISLWHTAMRNPLLCADARAHIEYVLSMEYLTV